MNVIISLKSDSLIFRLIDMLSLFLTAKKFLSEYLLKIWRPERWKTHNEFSEELRVDNVDEESSMFSLSVGLRLPDYTASRSRRT